ncbi:YcjF family protein [Enhygromyxa salina]|uniref:GTPase domain-containing protein n=1 Tax=Enhygromyxa salina TaxID=215803 RepID=A0A2S9YTR6_9BACT|nr:DUF697 domain-containing protein [Enhygromyxa salina]PRQ08470.1 hypothetical protein ENSA7_17550 [Enhygromyxa salina]
MITDSNSAPTSQVTVDPAARLDLANLSVQRNVYWAMGAGVLPLPLFDLVAITGVQLKMLRELSKIYDVAFKEGVAKKAVTSLLVGIGGVGIGGVIGLSMFKFVPFVGPALGVVSVPVVSGMLTHAVGRTFVMHFEAGGTLLDFDAKKMRAYFKEEYGNAKDVVENMQKPKGATQSA